MEQKTKRVLVLDGNQRSALAATRSLGQRGVHVTVGETTETSLAGVSKFCAGQFRYPSPYEDQQAFLEAVAAECRARNIDILLPMTDITMHPVLQHRGRFRGAVVPFASFDAYEMLTDKWRLFELARELNLSMPQTHFVRDLATLHDIRPQLRYPLVIKPYRSRIMLDGKWVCAAVQYADSWEELKATVSRCEYFARHPFLLQEYIHGENQGVFALYDNGRPLVFFYHRRIREKPPSGGVAVVAESTAPSPKNREIAERLLSHVGWHGVAMVEYKTAPDGTPYMLEVNARFWATLQLAVDAGVDFPWLLYHLANGTPPPVEPEFKVGVRSRWLIGDMIHAWMTIRGRDVNRYESYSARLRSVCASLSLFQRRTHNEIFRLCDTRPFIFELKRYLRRAAA